METKERILEGNQKFWKEIKKNFFGTNQNKHFRSKRKDKS